jgi:hypothetical protein
MGKPHPSTTSSISEHTTSELLSLTFSISYLSFLWLFEKKNQITETEEKGNNNNKQWGYKNWINFPRRRFR